MGDWCWESLSLVSFRAILKKECYTFLSSSTSMELEECNWTALFIAEAEVEFGAPEAHYPIHYVTQVSVP